MAFLTDVLKYLQIRNVTCSLIKENKLSFGLSEVENTLMSSTEVKISEFYGILSKKGDHSSFLTL